MANPISSSQSFITTLQGWFDFHGYGYLLIKGGILTLELGILSLIAAVVLGLLSASARISDSPTLRTLSMIYTTITRSIPDLILLLLIYYGLQAVINVTADKVLEWSAERINVQFTLDPFLSGVLAIGLIFGAYMSETFRGAFQSVSAGQIEAAQAYGMSKWQVFSRMRLPLMMRHALPGIGNNWMVLSKTTALVSLISLHDIVFYADEAGKSLHAPFHFLLPVIIGYLIIAALSELVMKRLERRYNIGFKDAL